MAEDFSLSAELNIQKINVDASKINQSIDKAEIKNLKIKPVMTVADLRKALPVKTLGIRLKISNVPEIKKQLQKALNLDDIGQAFNVKQSKSKAPTSTVPIIRNSKQAEKVLKDLDIASKATGVNVETAAEALNKFLDRLKKGTGTSGGFFESAANNLTTLISKLNSNGVLDQFAGKNAKSLSNLTSALEFVFNETKRLDNAAAKLDRLGVLSPALLKQIDEAKASLQGLLSGTEISNISTIKQQVQSFINPLSEAFRKAEKDAEDFEKTIADLTQRSIELNKSGRGRSELAANLSQQSSSLQTSRSKGFSFSDGKTIIADLLERERVLVKVTKSAEAADLAVNKVLTTKIDTDLNSTLAAEIIGSPEQIEQLANNARKQLDKILRSPNKNSPTTKTSVDDIKNNLNEGVKSLESDVKSLDSILNNLDNKKLQFDNEGLDASSKAVMDLRGEIIRLVKAGTNLKSVEKNFQSGLVDVETVNQRERALNRYIGTLNRLQVSIQGSDKFDDIVGASDGIDKAIIKLRELSAAGSSPEVLQRFIAETSVAARASDKLNSKVGSLRNKFTELQDVQNTSFRSEVYRNAGASFDSYVSKVVSGTGTVRQKLTDIELQFAKLRATAAIEAEGGLLGSFAKLSGLATKRLLSFLVVARLTFTIQDVFLSSVNAALELETQIVKLEQVFSKTASSEQVLIQRTDAARNSIFDLAQTYGVAVTEVAKASRILAQAGFIGSNLEKSLQAIIKANLGPTFNDINQTAEASIAILNQFNKEASDLETILGGINQVSALYAVESEGIAKAVRKAGGAFNAAGGSISEFVGAFTILKKETREADEALATALRNIGIRLQRTSTQNKVGNILGIDFRDQNDQFIGVIPSLNRVKDALDELGIASTDPRFAQVVENLAGARQFARLIPLLENLDELNEIQDKYKDGAKSLDTDAVRALTTIQNKVEQLRSTFAELTQTILTSKLFKTLLDLFNGVVKGANAVIQAIDGISFAMLALGSIAIPSILRKGLLSTFVAETGSTRSTPFLGNFIGRNRGGIIPGRGPNVDTVPAMLTRGEFVFSRKAVDNIGAGKLDELHQSARKGFNKGGRVGFNRGGSITGGTFSGVDEITRILKVFGISINQAGDNLVKSVSFAADEFLDSRSKGKKTVRGTNRGGEINVRSTLPLDQQASTLFHELSHALDVNTSKLDESTKNKLIKESKKSPLGDFFKKRGGGGNQKREQFADLGRLAIFKQLRDDNGGKASSLEPKQITNILNKLSDRDAKILDKTSALLNKVGGLTTSSRATSAVEGVAANVLGGKASSLNRQSSRLEPISTRSTFKGGGGGPRPPFIELGKKIASSIAKFVSFNKYLLLGGAGLAGIASISATLKSSFSDLATAVALSVITYKLSNSTIGTFGKTAKSFIGDFKGGKNPLPDFTDTKNGSIAGKIGKSFRGRSIDRSTISKSFPTFSSIGSGVKKGAGKLLPNSISKLGPLVSKMIPSFGGLLKAFTTGGPYVLAATTAFGFLTSAAKASADEMINTAKTEKELEAGISQLKAVSAIESGFGLFTLLGNAGSAVSEFTSNFGTALLGRIPIINSLGNAFTSVKNAVVDFATDDKEFQQIRNVNSSRINASEFGEAVNKEGGVDKEGAAKEFSEVVPVLSAAIKDGAFQAGQTMKDFIANNPDLKNTAQKVSNDLTKAVESGVSLDEITANLDPKEFQNFSKLLNAVGVSLDASKIDKARTAIDQISLFFSRMEQSVENAANRMTAVEGNLSVFDQQFNALTGQSFDFSVPTQAFDLLKKGIDPQSLGLSTKGLTNGLGTAGAEAFNLEFAVNKLSRELNEKILAAGSTIKFDPNQNTSGGAIADALLSGVQGLNIAPDIKKLYSTFLDANEQELGNAIVTDGSGSSIGSDKITALNEKFAKQFSGAIDNIKRRLDIEKSFTERYKTILDQRISLEEKSRSASSTLLGIRKESTQFQNRLSDPSGNGALSVKQARSFDAANLKNLLSGTGVQATSVGDLQKAFQASFSRSRNLRDNRNISDKQRTLGLTREGQVQKQIESVFASLAQGGDGLRASFENFDSVLEKTKNTNDKFRQSLLGSDSDLVNMAKGIDAFNAVVGSGNKIQATTKLLSLDESTRSGLSSVLSDDPDRKAAFDKALGITNPNATNVAAQGVQGELKVREQAAQAQIQIANMQISSMDNLANSLSKNEQIQLKNLEQSATTVQLANAAFEKTVAQIPTEIVHNHNIPEIGVRIFGGESLGTLPAEFQKMIASTIEQKIRLNNENIAKKNRGFNV